LLLDIRRQHPRASASLIVRTLEADGRLAPKQVSAATVRRLFRAHGLDRQSMKSADADVRRRWQAAHPHALAGSPRGVTPPGLPQIRTCGTPASGSSVSRVR
jgi:hypothetical protein